MKRRQSLRDQDSAHVELMAPAFLATLLAVAFAFPLAISPGDRSNVPIRMSWYLDWEQFETAETLVRIEADGTPTVNGDPTGWARMSDEIARSHRRDVLVYADPRAPTDAVLRFVSEVPRESYSWVALEAEP